MTEPPWVAIAAAPELILMSAQSSEAAPSNSSLDAWLSDMGFVYDPSLERVRNPFDFLRAEDDLAIQESFVPVLDPRPLLRPMDLVVLALPGAGKTALRVMVQQQADKIRHGEIKVEEETEYQARETRGLLRATLIERFNGSELRDLCFDLKVDYDNLEGDTKPDKARELIAYLERRQRLADIEKIGRRLRPDIPWDTIFLPSGFTSKLMFRPSPLDLAMELEDLLCQRQITGQTASRESAGVLLDATECSVGQVVESAVLSILQRVPRQERHWCNVFFKLFLPLRFKPFTMGFRTFELDWTPENLQNLLANRIKWASKGRLSQLAQLCDDVLLRQVDPDAVLARLSITPRRLLQIGQELFAFQQTTLKSRHPHHAAAIGERISCEVWQQCIERARVMPLELALQRAHLEPVAQRARPAATTPPVARSVGRKSRGVQSDNIHLELRLKEGKVCVNLQGDSKGMADPGCELEPPPEWDDDTDARRDWGQILYDVLFRGQVRDEYLRIRDANARNESPSRYRTRVHLHFDPNPPDFLLAQYPWEWLYDGFIFLVKNKRIEVVRHWKHCDEQISPQPLSVRLPLRVLYVAPRPKVPQGFGHESALRDRDSLLALKDKGLVDLYEFPQEKQTFDDFKEYLDGLLRTSTTRRRPIHVMHFDGHGVVGRRCVVCGGIEVSQDRCSECKRSRLEEAASYLLFEQSANRDKPHGVSADDIGAVLSGRGIRLVILSACFSAALREVNRPTASVASQLVLAGVNGAIGMQWKVDGKRTGEFVQNFYRYLTESRLSVIDALALSRSALGPGNDWATPALYLQNDDEDGNLFRIRPWETRA